MDAGYRRDHPAERMGQRRAAHHAGSNDVRARHDRHRGRSHADGRGRLPRETGAAAKTVEHSGARTARGTGQTEHNASARQLRQGTFDRRSEKTAGTGRQLARTAATHQ